jgi:hypothetical protein
MDVPGEWYTDTEQDIIAATDISVVFGMGYHSWVVATKNEDVMVSGGGPDDGDQLLTASYRSELVFITSGITVIDTLPRYGKIKVRSVKLVCDNEVAIKACKRKCTQSVFHRTEEDHDLISTIHYLQEIWCQDIYVQYEWVKKHPDDLNREVTKYDH